jgi:hypothetical protein
MLPADNAHAVAFLFANREFIAIIPAMTLSARDCAHYLIRRRFSVIAKLIQF